MSNHVEGMPAVIPTVMYQAALERAERAQAAALEAGRERQDALDRERWTKAENERLRVEAAEQEKRWNASHEYARISEYRRRTHNAEARVRTLLVELETAREGLAKYEPDPQHYTVTARDALATARKEWE